MDLSHIKQQLILYPLSLLGGYKIEYISNLIKEYKIKNFLEIGTWMGGSIYSLSKSFPDSNFDTLDINDYEKMYQDNLTWGFSDYIETVTGESLSADLIKSIQYFYNVNSFNATFYSIENFDWRNRTYDAILIDGDHNLNSLRRDFCDSFAAIEHNGFILIDDVSFKYLKQEVESLCRHFRQKIFYISIERRKDLAVIRIDKKLKKYPFTWKEMFDIQHKRIHNKK